MVSVALLRRWAKGIDLKLVLPKNVLLEPIMNPETWLSLGWGDVIQSYRRTFLGPFWITLNMAIFSFAMTIVYGALFGIPTREYAAYIVCGMISWFWISGLIIEGGTAFLTYAQYIRGMPIEKSQFVWAVAFKQIVVFFHNIIVYIIIVFLGIVDININTFLIIPSVVLFFLLSIPLISMLSIIYIRYRDFQKLMASAIIILLLLSPIFWQPDRMTGWRASIVDFNPIYYVLEMIRGPLLGNAVPITYYIVLSILTAFLWLFGGLFYRRYHRFIIYWT
jgi:ABC-type polysaccharide/polyol phosphate export permease